MPALGRSLLVILCVLLAAPPVAGAAEGELRVIPLKHRLAEEVVPALRPLLGSGESLSGMDSRLIVRASPRTLAAIERVLGEIDVARRNLRISVRHGGEREARELGLGASGEAHSGSTRIVVSGDSGTGSGAGAGVGGRGPGGALQLRTERRVTTARDSSTQTLTVLDGGRAFLRVGESIPEVQPFLVLVGSRLGVVAGVQYHDVTTGFEVEPRLMGETVQLVVAPRLAFRSDRGAQTVSFEELRTVLTVKSGEWVDLGGAVEAANEVNRRILGVQRTHSSGATRFLVRVDLL
jgi:type II secretory pathway component GspD/PulD (secretin)